MNNDVIKVDKLLERLFDRPCTSTEQRVSKLLTKQAHVFGRFVDDNDKLVAVTAADLPFACYTAAAIMMLPPAAAEDAKKSGGMPDNIGEAFGEVLNVISRVFNTSDRPHCRYVGLEYGKPNSDVKAFIKGALRKASHMFEIGGYGRGSLSVFST